MSRFVKLYIHNPDGALPIPAWVNPDTVDKFTSTAMPNATIIVQGTEKMVVRGTPDEVKDILEKAGLQ